MIQCFRLCSARYPVNSGAGAALHGGGWNPKGVEVIYAAATASLAVVEVLVHFAVLPRDFVIGEINIPDDATTVFVPLKNLPRGWAAPIPIRTTQQIGARWVKANRSAVLAVPSVVVPTEKIYLLNPKHPEFNMIRFLRPQPFRFDPRFK